MKKPFSCIMSSLSFSISRYLVAILKFIFASHTIRVLFDPFIATLKISTAISSLLLFLILIPPHQEFKLIFAKTRAIKMSQIVYFICNKDYKEYYVPFYMKIFIKYIMSVMIGLDFSDRLLRQYKKKFTIYIRICYLIFDLRHPLYYPNLDL
jgi:hypothetical protein